MCKSSHHFPNMYIYTNIQIYILPLHILPNGITLRPYKIRPVAPPRILGASDQRIVSHLPGSRSTNFHSKPCLASNYASGACVCSVDSGKSKGLVKMMRDLYSMCILYHLPVFHIFLIPKYKKSTVKLSEPPPEFQMES